MTDDQRDILAAIGSEWRIWLLYLICSGVQEARDLQKETGLSKSSLSQHMKKLIQAWLVRRVGHGKFARYEPLNEAKVLIDAFVTVSDAVEAYRQRLENEARVYEERA